MHWLFPKKEKTREIKPIPGPQHRRANYTRRATPRPAPKKTKTVARPVPKTVPNAVPNTQGLNLNRQLKEMKQATNKLRNAYEINHAKRLFARNGVRHTFRAQPNSLKLKPQLNRQLKEMTNATNKITNKEIKDAKMRFTRNGVRHTFRAQQKNRV